MGRTPQDAVNEFMANYDAGNDAANDELVKDLDTRDAGPVIESR